MAVTTISDVIVPEVYGPYQAEMSNKATRIVTSGAVTADAANSARLGMGGDRFNIPSWRHIGDPSDNYGTPTDNAASKATPSAVVGRKQIAPRIERNKFWASPDLVAALAGDDPMAQVATTVAKYQSIQRQRTFLLIVKALVQSGGPLNGQTVTAAGAFDSDSFIDAKQVAWGDFSESYGTLLAVHSKIYARMQKDNIITFEPTNAQDIGFGTYLNSTILVDDYLTAHTVTGSPQTLTEDTGTGSPEGFISLILRYGATGFAYAMPKTPVEINREPLEADGGGVEYFGVRDCYNFHVYGTSYTGTIAGDVVSDVELANSANWGLVWDRKQVGVAAVISTS